LAGLGLVASRGVAEKEVTAPILFMRAEHSFMLGVCYSWAENTPIAMVLVFAVRVGAAGVEVVIPDKADILVCGDELPRLLGLGHCA